MKKILSVILGIFLCASLLCGCSKGGDKETTSKETAATTTQQETTTAAIDEEILGTWSEDYFDSGFTFNADGTGMDTFWELSFTYTAKDGVLVVTYDEDLWGVSTYKYEISGSEITMKRQNDDDAVTTTYKKAGSSGSDETDASDETTAG